MIIGVSLSEPHMNVVYVNFGQSVSLSVCLLSICLSVVYLSVCMFMNDNLQIWY